MMNPLQEKEFKMINVGANVNISLEWEKISQKITNISKIQDLLF